MSALSKNLVDIFNDRRKLEKELKESEKIFLEKYGEYLQKNKKRGKRK